MLLDIPTKKVKALVSAITAWEAAEAAFDADQTKANRRAADDLNSIALRMIVEFSVWVMAAHGAAATQERGNGDATG